MRSRFNLNFSTGTALFLLATSVCFSAPVRRLAAVVTSGGIFQQALAAADVTDTTTYAAKLANSLSSDPRICQPVLDLVNALVAGESDPTGVNSVGDRAIVGARKLLGLTDAPLSTVLTTLAGGPGSYDTHVRTALQQAFQNPPKTVASLQTYKYLVDTQAALQDLASLVGRVGGNNSIATGADATLPQLQAVEATIDKIGADFSVQNVLSQGVDIQQILDTLAGSATNVTALAGLNKSLASSITAATKTATDAMDNLVTSAKSAAAIAASSTPVVPDSAFTDSPPPGTACK